MAEDNMEVLEDGTQGSKQDVMRRHSSLDSDLSHVMRASQDQTRRHLLTRQLDVPVGDSNPSTPVHPGRMATVSFQPEIRDSPRMAHDNSLVALIPDDAIYFGSKQVQCHVLESAKTRSIADETFDPLDIASYSPTDIKRQSNYIIVDVRCPPECSSLMFG